MILLKLNVLSGIVVYIMGPASYGIDLEGARNKRKYYTKGGQYLKFSSIGF